jgi:ABC-2 type transport system ATP-binding protein
MENNALEIKNLSKTFKLPHERHSGLKQSFVNLFNTDRGFEVQQVLDGIEFDIKRGDFFGIVGRNGSGKSTLLKILAGIYTPDSGSVRVNGTLTPFIELGVGFNPELTGKENVFLNGALLGFSRAEMARVYDEIISFAELEKFMDQKLKNYSSGMQVRLAFSIAIQAKSDILLIDEVLAVGDAAFQQKCFNYFHRLKKEGRTVVLVSHDRGALERFCTNGVLINDGRLISQGKIKDVLSDYSQVVLGEISPTAPAEPAGQTTKKYAEIKNVKILDIQGQPRRKFRFGEPITLAYQVSIKQPLDNPITGITVWDKTVEKALLATNTLIDQNEALKKLEAGDVIDVSLSVDCRLNDGEYVIEPAIANESATIFYDQKPAASSFVVSGSNNPHSTLSANQKLAVTIKKNG